MEQKLENSSEVVVSIMRIQDDNKDAHIEPQSKEVHRQKSYTQIPVETSSFSPRTPKLSFLPNQNMPSEASFGAETEEGSVSSPRVDSSTCKKKGNVRTTSRIEEVAQDSDEEENSDGEDDDKDVYDQKNPTEKQKKADKWEVMYMINFTLCSCIVAVFITSVAVPSLRDVIFWGLEIWRWCVLLFVLFCGKLLTKGFTNVLVFLIERNYVLKKKVLYFVHSLKRSVQVFFWLALILLTWVILIRKRLKEPKDTIEVLHHVTRFLECSVFGAGLWVIKTLLVKILACSFHVKRFFDRIQDSIFHQYVLLILSEPPLRKDQSMGRKKKPLLILENLMKGKLVDKQLIDVNKLSKMIKDNISAWTISGLIDVIQSSGLATISGALDGTGNADITNEEDARKAGNRIFNNVAAATGRNPRYIEEADLLLFLKKENVPKVFDMFKCSAHSKKIKRRAIRDWVVEVYNERELLGQSIKDAKTAIEEMNRILSGIALIVIIVVWLVLMGLVTTEMLIFLSSQLLVATFIFGNSCKTGFECILYIFVMHPYDVGDHCIIEGVQMTVEEMNILTTVFKSGKETIVYPNLVLSTKPISNFHRTPVLSESVEFVIDVSTSDDTIATLKNKIQAYIEEKDNQWNQNHQFKQIKHENKLKMVLYVNPITRFQDYAENSGRRPELLSKIKVILEELDIKYHYLPQEVHLSNVESHGQ